MLRREAIIRRGLAIADSLAILSSLFLIFAIGGRTPRPAGVALVVPVFILLVKALGLYDRDEHVLHKTTLDEAPRLFGLATATTLMLWLADGLLASPTWSKGEVIALWGVLTVMLLSLRTVARGLAALAQPPERCLVVGDPADAQFLREQIELSPAIRAVLVRTVTPLRNGSDVPQLLPDNIGDILLEERIDRVIVARPPGALEEADNVLNALRRLRAYGVRISLLPSGQRVNGAAVAFDHLPGVTLLGIRGLEISRSSQLVKRAFDVAGASAALIALSPFLIVAAIAIKLDSPGPILFRQRRIGRHSREFTMLKFRSMVSEADQLKEELRALNEGGPGLFKIAADPRVTRAGKLLRRLSLDELPQLWNVLCGQMSLVGPRPLVPEEDLQIQGWHRRRLDVRPGMTGHWQILCLGRRITLVEMAKLDYLYVANWSLWSDIRLLLRTVPFVLGGHGV